MPIVNALVAVAVTVTDAPRLTEEPLIVMALFVSEAFAMLVSVLVDPLIEVPANVVIVPPKETEVEPMVMALLVSDALPMSDNVLLAPLIVLLVKVCAPVNVATVESIAIVTGEEPLNEVPDKPVPMVSVLVVLAVIVPEAPSATVTPL